MPGYSNSSDILEGRYVFVVAQVPFDNESQATAVVNTFGTLVPLLDPTGRYIDAQTLRDEFPNRSLAWWLLRPGSRGFAEPGRLVSAYVETAPRFDGTDPEKDRYQVVADTVEVVSARIAIEILTTSDERINRVQDLVNFPDPVVHDHPPTDLVLVRWQRRLYGPFRASTTRRSDGRWTVGLAASGADATVLSIRDDKLLLIGEAYQSFRQVEVSLDSLPPRRALQKRTCTYELVTGSGLDHLRSMEAEVVSVARDIDVIKRFAARLLGRRDRQQLSQLLESIVPELPERDWDGPDARSLIERVSSQLAAEDGTAREIAEGLIESGLITDAVQRGIDARVDRYIAENAARLRADVAKQLSDGEDAVRRLREEREQLGEELRLGRRKAEAKLERDLGTLREAFDGELVRERAELTRERRVLEQERESVVRHLDAVTTRFETARAEVLRDFAAMWPLYQRVVGSVELDSRHEIVAQAAVEPPAAAQGREDDGERVISFPAFVTRTDDADRPAMAEEAFMDRLQTHLRARGFVYAQADIIAFHLSAKCGDITILGGVSGTGKSSLPRLYAEAQMGSEYAATDEACGRYLHVAVRPSWLDQDDLLGHVNTLDRRYLPSESGLYALLVRAQEEYSARRLSAGPYLVCLDEMNLAHVEHYLAGILQALERGEGLRRVSVFDRGSVRSLDPYARWAALDLPPTLRFIGTVNYDETTRPLSRRLLDRANVVELRDAGSYDFGAPRADGDRALAQGDAVSARDLRTWVHDRTLDARYAEVLDAMRAPLLSLQCPVTPRRFHAIGRFVASANALCTPDVAFDMQVCQRVLPQVRGAYGPVEREALEELARVIESRGFLPEAAKLVSAIVERDVGGSA